MRLDQFPLTYLVIVHRTDAKDAEVKLFFAFR